MPPLTWAGAGLGAALAAPVWLRGQRWRRLLEPASLQPIAAPSPAADLAVRAALKSLRLLARLPGGLWRNTCLYRSVVTCLVLRRYRVDARLRIGVAREEGETGAILAHAWVLRPGEDDLRAEPRAATMTVLDGSA